MSAMPKPESISRKICPRFFAKFTLSVIVLDRPMYAIPALGDVVPAYDQLQLSAEISSSDEAVAYDGDVGVAGSNALATVPEHLRNASHLN